MSNSKVITGLLNTDCTTITETLKSYMDTKLNEINTHMTATIQQHMTENIHKFYTGFGDLDNDDEITNILFDNVCDKTIIDEALKCYTSTHISDPHNYDSNSKIVNPNSILCMTNEMNNYTTPDTQQYKQICINKINTIKNKIKRLTEWTPKTKCFILGQTTQYSTGHAYNNTSTIRTQYYFNNFIITKKDFSRNNNIESTTYEVNIHSFPYNMLFTIKNIFNDFNIPSNTCGRYLPSGCNNILETYNKNPHYFMPNVRDFESNCKIEYEEIEEKQSELDKLIDINKTKIDYYKQLENEQKDIENKQQLLKVDKEKLAMAYAKFNLMRDTFIKEKTAFDLEIERTKQLKLQTETQSFDIDKFLQ